MGQVISYPVIGLATAIIVSVPEGALEIIKANVPHWNMNEDDTTIAVTLLTLTNWANEQDSAKDAEAWFAALSFNEPLALEPDIMILTTYELED